MYVYIYAPLPKPMPRTKAPADDPRPHESVAHDGSGGPLRFARPLSSPYWGTCCPSGRWGPACLLACQVDLLACGHLLGLPS